MPASGVIFFGNSVKTLKSSININGNASVTSGSIDPSSVATLGSAGDLYISTSTKTTYQKQDSGTTTNWTAFDTGITGITALTGDVTASGTGSVAATVNNVGGSTAANIHSADFAANAATNLDTNSTIVKRDSSGNFSATTITANLTGTASGNTIASAGDINETLFSAANNQSAAANVTGLTFAAATVRATKILLSVYVNATASLYEFFELNAIQKGSSWSMAQTSVGDNSGFAFTITNAGQIQYTSTNNSGFTAATVKFRALTISV